MCIRALRSLSLAALASALTVGAFACSLQNQEGPDVTCEELRCGQVNACQEGIIAQCVDGHTVRFHVCGTTDVCTAEWQVEGEYRCAFEDTDCEGCRPERTLGCADPILEGGGDQGRSDQGGGDQGGSDQGGSDQGGSTP